MFYIILIEYFIRLQKYILKIKFKYNFEQINSIRRLISFLGLFQGDDFPLLSFIHVHTTLSICVASETTIIEFDICGYLRKEPF